MIRLFFLWCGCVLCLSCGPKPTTAPTITHDVAWQALVRDHTTASAYQNHRIRVQLDAAEYEHADGEVRVWAGARTMPPVLVFKLAGKLEQPAPIVIVGTVRHIIRDGVWRSPRTDFCVTVEGCTTEPVVVRP